MDAAPSIAARTWILDVDGTIVDSLTGTSLRPGAAALLERLAAAGITVRVWSAGGADYARERAAAVGIDHLVATYHDKDGRDADGRYLVGHLPTTIDGVVFVDDRPEDLPRGADVIDVPPYLAPNPHDHGLDVALARAT